MTQIFGFLFSGTDKAERQSVEVMISPAGLNLKSPYGSQFLPSETLSVSWNGLSNNQLIFSEPSQSYLLYIQCEKKLLSAFIHQTSGSLQIQLEAIRNNIQSSQKTNHRLSVLFAVVVTICLLLVGAWFSLFWLRDLIVAQIPIPWESEFGRLVLKEEMTSSKECSDKRILQAIDTIAQRLFKVIGPSPYHFQFHVVKSSDVNAFALPGGQMMIYTALIAKAPSPESVAGVMAHEMQHVLSRHGLKRIVSQVGMGLMVPLIFGDMGSVTATVASMGSGLLTLKFDRGQESEADRQGLALMNKAGINPQGMIQFFEQLSQVETKSGQLIDFISTHPSSTDRVAQLQEIISQLPTATAYPPLVPDWAQIRKAADAFTQAP